MMEFVKVRCRTELNMYVKDYCKYIDSCTGEPRIRAMVYNGVMAAIHAASNAHIISYVEMMGLHTIVKNPSYCNAYLRSLNDASPISSDDLPRTDA